MTKKQLIDRISKKSDGTKKEIAQTVDLLLAVIEDALIHGEDVQISGFGSFSVKEKAEYTGRNPKTNQPVQVPPSKRVTFSAGKTLKEKLNAT